MEKAKREVVAWMTGPDTDIAKGTNRTLPSFKKVNIRRSVLILSSAGGV